MDVWHTDVHVLFKERYIQHLTGRQKVLKAREKPPVNPCREYFKPSDRTIWYRFARPKNPLMTLQDTQKHTKKF